MGVSMFWGAQVSRKKSGCSKMKSFEVKEEKIHLEVEKTRIQYRDLRWEEHGHGERKRRCILDRQ